MVTVKITKGVGPNLLTFGLGRVTEKVLQYIRELIQMNSSITRIKKMISKN